MAYVIDHEDIWIESEQALSWQQRLDETLDYENLSINQEKYQDYQPSKLQFHLSSSTPYQNIKINIPYANRLDNIQIKESIICRYDEVEKDWVSLPFENDEIQKKFLIEVDQTGVYAIFVNQFWYSSFTQRLANEYPNWTKVRNDQESIGQQFLNFFGTKLEELTSYLEWIQEQKYIGTADLKAHDWIYMYRLPSVKRTDEIRVYQPKDSAEEEIPILETIKSFFYNDKNKGCIIDYDENRLYTTKFYGPLKLDIISSSVSSHSIEPENYHLWNAFDEFGLLLGIERRHLETNQTFKERILDVFRYPSGSHDIGLTNGIGRDLGLIYREDKNGKTLIWQDDTKDFLLKNTSGKRIDPRTIKIDNQSIYEEEYQTDEIGNIRIFSKHTGQPHTISFIAGIEKYQLYDKKDLSLYQRMFQPNGQATSTLRHWVEYINTVAPIMWNRFNWDEGFWDTIDKEATGLGYIPNTWDSSIDGWKDYVFESDS